MALPKIMFSVLIPTSSSSPPLFPLRRPFSAPRMIVAFVLTCVYTHVDYKRNTKTLARHGSNPKPQSKTRKPVPVQYHPTNHPPINRVEGLHSKVKEVYAGSVHSCVLTREGTVYAFGKHEYTGHGDQEDVLEPRLIPIFSSDGGDGGVGGEDRHLVRQISVGPGGYHTMALTCQVLRRAVVAFVFVLFCFRLMVFLRGTLSKI